MFQYRLAVLLFLAAWVNSSGLATADEEHWAFRPIRGPQPPAVDNTAWAQTPIDRFILARLEDGGLAPSGPAERRTLIRRATFDLVGLPPTPAAIAAYLEDNAPAATARLVERLLASPQYGERWGRHWLDLARYADNKGYVFFEDKRFPWAYTYRDYVIRALNDDLPFDRFVVEQLAADQLDLGDDHRPLTALGFLTVGGHFMNNTHDIIDDRIDVVTRGLMGLTVTCARCHDHKYDPIPQADYYALYGVFRGSTEPILPPLFEPPPDTQEYRTFAQELAQREKALVDFVTQKHAALVEEARTRIADYLLAAHARRGQPPADDFMLLVDQGDLNPTMILRWQIYLEDPDVHANVWLPWRKLAELPSESFAAEAADLLERLFASPAAAVHPAVRRPLLAAPLTSMAEVAGRYQELLQAADHQWREALARAEQTGEPRPERLTDLAAESLRQVLYGLHSPADAPLAMDWGFLSLFPDRPTQDEYKKLLKAVEEWSMTGAGAPPRAMVLRDAPAPHHPRIFRRGNPNRLGDPVPRRFLSAVAPRHKTLDTGSGRVDLAAAIVDPANPLTARVLANRIWMHHFGQGLVRTPSDFGLRGERPSHPELLDYLAAELIDSGWSVKHLHRLIVNSAVYQQRSPSGAPRTASGRDPRLVDPENRLLWKMNRRRLEFEALRDALQFVSGRLDTTMFGPPVDMFGGEADSRRRAIYGYIDRMDVSSLLTTFDFPNPASTSPQRTSTTVAPQALYLMNGPLVSSAARHLAQRRDTLGLPDRASGINALYTVLFGREPTARERELAQAFLGDTPSPERRAALAQALLMTNEFVFID